MARVKRGNVSRKYHKKILKRAKGFRAGLSKLFRPAHQSVLHALSYAYKHRRQRRRDFRALWIVRLNAALDQNGVSYSQFMGKLHHHQVLLNRKMLSEIAIHHPETLLEIIKLAK